MYPGMSLASKALLTTSYGPPVSYMAAFKQMDIIYLEQWENYQKGSYRNRMQIATGNGQLTLSVPLQRGKHQRMPVREVRIDYQQPWLKIHRDSILTAYRSAPYFLDYSDGYFNILNKKPAFLFDLNMAFLEFILQCWSLTPRLELSNSYELEPAADVIDLRNAFKPGKEDKPRATYPAYPQVFDDRIGFLEDLSCIDLLFCQGPEGVLYLNQLSSTEL